MALEPLQQLERMLLNSKNVLILLPQNPGGDLIGAGWALYFFLERKEINAEIVFQDETENVQKFSFLPRPTGIKNSVSEARDFILSFNTRYNKITNYWTEEKEDEFKIYITPEKGSIDPRDFSFIPAKFKYDLVIVLGCSDREMIGRAYFENPDIFYEIPVVNIDNQSANENFGQINIVELTTSSVCEILYAIIEKINNLSMDEKIAQCLLTGIISATESFQNRKTTPRSLQTAAKLMDSGADQQSIVRHLYKTQPFNVLKLWGRIMARLKFNQHLKLAWSQAYLEDFVQSRTSPRELFLVVDKIKENYSSGRFFLLLYEEKTDEFSGIIKCTEPEKIEKIAEIFKGELSNEAIVFRMPKKNPDETEKEIVEKIGRIPD